MFLGNLGTQFMISLLILSLHSKSIQDPTLQAAVIFLSGRKVEHHLLPYQVLLENLDTMPARTPAVQFTLCAQQLFLIFLRVTGPDRLSVLDILLLNSVLN